MTKAIAPLFAGAALIALSPLACAQSGRAYDFNLEAQSLSNSLQVIASTVGKELMVSGDAVANRRSVPLRGHFTLDVALKELLRGTELVADIRDDAILIHPSGKEVGRGRESGGDEIVVTGSHIRGQAPSSPVTVASREEIERRGFDNLGSFARSLVQNFSGGQNPSVAGVGQGTSENVTSSSTLNLRGLGPDATLTLVNGHRIAYDAIGQGIDISAIPLAAIERVEVLADGSSALYGSDAVGGVANIILRRDYDGAKISARFGAATDGGDEEQQYSAVSGKRWNTGGFMVAGDYRRNTAITSAQRSYTQNLHPSGTLLTPQRQYGAVLSGDQNLTDGLTFEFDGQFSDRKHSLCTNFSATASCYSSGNASDVHTRSWSIAPQIKLEIEAGWQFRLAGTLGESAVDQSIRTYSGGVLFQRQQSYYTNRLKTLELGADGPLFALPGGNAEMAIGVGLRHVNYDTNGIARQSNVIVQSRIFTQKRETYYAFGELSLPLISPANGISLVDRLNLSAAVRYEDTPHIGRLATPKLGATYAPIKDVAFKVSWGKSFKAPTLFQTGVERVGFSQLGTSFTPQSPAAGTVLSLTGGNPDLRPEKATSLTGTMVITPSFIDGLRIEASYFKVKYRDRVVNPIPNNFAAFAAAYSAYVTLNPTREQLLAAIASAAPPIYNQGGGDVTTANVVAIVTNYFQNAAIQNIEGVDLAADYRFMASDRDKIHVSAAASYLKSEQQLTATQPVLQIAGMIYRAPRWRAQSSIDWTRDNFSLTGAFTFIGGSLDTRLAPDFRVGSFKSVDAIARLKTSDSAGLFSGIEFTLSLLNILNEKPSYARTTSPQSFNFDSTNFPNTGRMVNLTVSKSF